jgi:acyl-CoA synthetase (AMP-forming)/AMP-acid ligase II
MSGVDDVAVIGIKDPKSGEVPRAFVVRRKGKSFYWFLS